MFPKSLITKQMLWITQAHIHTHIQHYWRWWGTKLSTQTSLGSWQNPALIHGTALQVNGARPSLDHPECRQNYSQALHLHSVPASDVNTNGTQATPGSRYLWISILSLDRPRSGIVPISTQFCLKDASIWNFLVVFRIIWISTTLGQFMKVFSVLWINTTLPLACVISLLFRELGLLPNDK